MVCEKHKLIIVKPTLLFVGETTHTTVFLAKTKHMIFSENHTYYYESPGMIFTSSITAWVVLKHNVVRTTQLLTNDIDNKTIMIIILIIIITILKIIIVVIITGIL